jgi:hypothetical protein
MHNNNPAKQDGSNAGKLQLPSELDNALVEVQEKAMVEELVKSGKGGHVPKSEQPCPVTSGRIKQHAGSAVPPLFHARRRPGRPRKVKSSHISATSPHELAENKDVKRGALAYSAVSPRLLTADQAARYLGISYWSVRNLEAAGTLKRISIPGRLGNDMRRLLYDKADLDRHIQLWKDQN